MIALLAAARAIHFTSLMVIFGGSYSIAARASAALYVMSWSDFVRRDADGNVIVDSRSWDRQSALGEALWLPPLPPNSVENIGTADLRLIAVELK